MGLSGFSQCGSPSLSSNTGNTVLIPKEADIEGLSYINETETEYAQNYKIYNYEEGYKLLYITESRDRFLIVPEDGDIPEGADESIHIIKRPIKNIYLVASAVMDMFAELDAIDTIRFSGKKESDWYIEEAVKAMQEQKLIYAGKYNKPDYEMIVSGDCSLIIENTMIYHSPEVMEQFEKFGIPVMIEYSNYESHPLGRVEWIKFYGALLGLEDEADAIFEEQKRIVDEVKNDQDTGKTVAYFYITSNNLVQVRKTSDHIPKMIEIAGGKYVFDDLNDDSNKKTSVNMQIEEFYVGAKDADILIYNSSIDGGVNTLDDLLSKNSLLEDFKAVKEGNVWCTTKDMYQESLSAGYMIEDINKVLNEDYDDLHYLYKLE